MAGQLECTIFVRIVTFPDSPSSIKPFIAHLGTGYLVGSGATHFESFDFAQDKSASHFTLI